VYFEGDEQAYLMTAYRVAMDSPDPSTQNGALLIDKDGKFLGYGFNRPSSGCYPVVPESLAHNKYFHYEHAERMAIFNSARYGIRTEGAAMVCPWASCHDCARAIVAAGITHLLRHQDVMRAVPDRWKESMAAGDELLKAGGVHIVNFIGVVGAPRIRFDGKEIKP
jgi:dCMP deaminase